MPRETRAAGAPNVQPTRQKAPRPGPRRAAGGRRCTNVVDERTEWLTLAHELTLAVHEANTTDEALHLVMDRICTGGRWTVGCVYLPDQGAPAGSPPRSPM